MTYHVLMMETGGTFATTLDDNGLRALSDGSVFDFPAVEEKIKGDAFTFTIKRPFHILSENMTVSRLEQLVSAIREINFAEFDGIIITHGTDTLAYSVNLIAFALGTVELPIVFVSANRPLNEPQSNGIVNFTSALDFIAQGEQGVFAIYQNGDGKIYVHRGGRIRQMDDIHAGFFSQGNVPYGEIHAGTFRLNEDPANCRQPRKGTGCPSSLLSRKILQIFPYPGLDYRRIDINHIDAILHWTYHTGMYCSAGQRESLDELLQRASEQKIDIILTGGSREENRYETKLKYGEPAIFLEDVAPEAVYAKMLLAYGAAEARTALAYVRANVLGEFIRP